MRGLSITLLVVLPLVACGDDSTGDDGPAGSTGAAMTGSSGGPGSTGGPVGSSGGGSTGATSTTAASTGMGMDSTGAMATDSTGAVEFAMTSPAFEEGGLFPGTMHISGGNVSPQLDWVGAPAGTMSFGVFFHDETLMFEHSAIWNIAADATGLPEGVEGVAMPPSVPGAVQCRNWTGEFGYGGPGSMSNFYTFTLYALDTADLAGEIDENSSLVAVQSALQAHSIGETTLTGQSNGP